MPGQCSCSTCNNLSRTAVLSARSTECRYEVNYQVKLTFLRSLDADGYERRSRRRSDGKEATHEHGLYMYLTLAASVAARAFLPSQPVYTLGSRQCGPNFSVTVSSNARGEATPGTT